MFFKMRQKESDVYCDLSFAVYQYLTIKNSNNKLKSFHTAMCMNRTERKFLSRLVYCTSSTFTLFPHILY